MRQQMWVRNRLVSLAGGVAVMAGVIAGCGSGQITQTDAHLPAVNGASAQVEDLTIRNALVAYPESEEHRRYPVGADVALTLTIANNSSDDDRLESVSTPAAADATIEGQREVRYGRALTIVSELEDDAGVGMAAITLNGLTHELTPGEVIIVTLSFREAGDVDVRVPVGAPDHERDPVEGEEAH